MTKMFRLILTQTLTHAFRKGGGAFGTCAFYIIIVTLFTFALGPDGMHAHAGAVMCVAMLLSSITAMPLMFERDHEDGTLEQFLLFPSTLEILVLAKIIGHWLAIILPIIFITPIMAILSGLDFDSTISALKLLLLASPSMVAISAVSAAITLGTKRGGLLQALITLPLYIPILIYASSGGALFLAAILCAAIPVTCLIVTYLIKMAVE